MPIRFLHISDIHLDKDHGYGSHYDQDADIRKQLINDLKKLVRADGSIDYVLVGGDIAGKGRKEEFESAKEFLANVTTVVGCSASSVLMVPGNHDVDRSKINTNRKAIQTQFKSAASEHSRSTLLNSYRKDGNLELLTGTLQNYFDFAAEYDSLPSLDNFRWERNLEVDGFAVRINGLNSAFLSNIDDAKIPPNQLWLGHFQRNINPDGDAINIVISHHPPEWLMDGKEAKQIFRDRSQLQLYGHMHEAEEETNNESLVIHAGALHPDRGEVGWNPRYNVIELKIIEKDGKNLLRAEIWMREWSKSYHEFNMKAAKGNAPTLVREIDISHLSKPKITAQSMSQKAEGEMTSEIMNTALETARRKLVYAFFQLPSVLQDQIAMELGLLNATDSNLSGAKRTQTILIRAKERNTFADLWEKVKTQRTDFLDQNNPFVK